VNVRYYIDPETDLPHIYGHNIKEMEVKEFLLKDGCTTLSRLLKFSNLYSYGILFAEGQYAWIRGEAG